MSARKVLVFGGSFNPPHRRHVSLAQQAAAAIGADEIRVIPANINPQRQDQPTTRRTTARPCCGSRLRAKRAP